MLWLQLYSGDLVFVFHVWCSLKVNKTARKFRALIAVCK